MQAILTRKIWPIKIFNFLLILSWTMCFFLFFLYNEQKKDIAELQSQIFEMKMEEINIDIDSTAEDDDYNEGATEMGWPYISAVWFDDGTFYNIKTNVV